MALPLDVDPSFGVIRNDHTPTIRAHEQPFVKSHEAILSFNRTTETATTSTSTTQQTVAYQNYDYYLPLYNAALKGNWEAAKTFIENDPGAATARINRVSFTALHVAAGEGRWEFVEKLAAIMPVEALAMQDQAGYTALHHAAIAGSMKTAVALVKRNPSLTNVLDGSGLTPLLVAARYLYGSYEILWYLTLVTQDEEPGLPFTGPHAMELVLMLVLAGCLDILLYLLQRYPGLATNTATGTGGTSLLSLLSLTPSNFLSGTRLGFWESFFYSVIPVKNSYEPPHSVRSLAEDGHGEGSAPSFIRRLIEAKHRHHCAVELFKQACTKIHETHGSLTEYFRNRRLIQFQATTFGIAEILKIMFNLCPDLMWVSMEDFKFPIHVAIEYRRENIFSFLCEKNMRVKVQADRSDRSGTVMHLAAKLAPFDQLSSVSGAAFQMQREMKWFKEVEKLVRPYSKTLLNERGKTAKELFTEEHKKLAEAGEKWMKDTSNSCMIVATLIATVVFTAAFTVPGGNNSDTGVPIFLRTNAFLVFAISDALALFSSLTSVLMFLSILTARYAEDDFLRSLPKRLIIGLASLFLAITTMMIAFGATLSIVLSKRLDWISVPTVLLASVPVAIFTLLQLPLFIEMARSTFGFTFRPQNL
ncbi:Ankyrin repeat-containing protein [Morus notabilis]|uniref:Ankyrin repeat-containing protein n=1 Tax=Morus notabilis TaxID=981085 RepID=W9QUX4_9ROSA|nr:Ankyrin repeat-containing protein [Morus notabilis]